MQRMQVENGMLFFVQHDAAGGVKRLVAGAHQIVAELLDARLVRDGRVRIGRAGGRIDGDPRRALPWTW